jgi:hypothetical protein
MKFTVQIEITELGRTTFSAVARDKGLSATGDGSSQDVAASRAVQNLVKIMRSSPPPFEENKDGKETFYIVTAGRHRGEVVKFLEACKTADGQDIYRVQCKDGADVEKPKFLIPTIKPPSWP